MNESVRRRAEEVFLEIVDLPEEERRAKLSKENAPLAAEVEVLLNCDASNKDDFLERPPLAASHLPAFEKLTSPEEATLDIGARLGRYQIIRLIGQGGMGCVYEVRQENPRRTVALKVIRPGLGSKGVLKRFEFEAQVLGQLQHPAIAAIYEAGSIDAPNGPQPFFAMEYVDGRPLIDHAKEKNLDTRQRLELMARICDGVQHAHERGLIHRDLKPANILVDARDQPKILDFGIARATNADLQMLTLQTDVGQLIGTVPYMSPEQVAGDSRMLDARSDVYSLGIILYELLTGRLPYEVRHCSIPEAARIIIEHDPSRLSSINTKLRGDVETILAKALEKDKHRRYSSASELAADIRRFLHDEPLRARPASAFYQWKKFARRHKGLVGGLAATVVALILGTFASLRFAIRAKSQESVAQRQAYRASLVAADAALGNHDVDEADRQLLAAPPVLRGWEWDHFHSRLDNSLLTIDMGNDRSLATLAIGLDGKSVIALRAGSAHDDPLQILTCKPFETPSTSNNEPIILAREFPSAREEFLSRTGRSLALLDMRTCRIEDALTGARRATFTSELFDEKCHLSWVSDDGQRVLFWREQERLSIDAQSSTLRRFARVGTWPVGFSPDCTLVADMPDMNHIVVQDATSGAILQSFPTPPAQLSAFAFSKDHRWMISADFDGTLRAFSLRGEPTPWQSLRLGGRVYSVFFSPDDAIIAATVQRNIVLLNSKTAEKIGTLVGHHGFVDQVTFSPDSGLLCSTGDDRFGRVWDASSLDDPRVLRGHELWVNPVAISQDGSLIATGSYDGTVRIWDAASSEPVATLQIGPQPPEVGGLSNIRGLAWSADGSMLAVYHDRITVLDAYTGRTLADLDAPKWYQHNLVFTPRGDRLIAAAYAWAISKDRKFTPLPPLPGTRFVARSPDGKLLAVDGEVSFILLADAESGKVLKTLRGHEQRAMEMAFSIDGKRLATASDDHTVRVWDVETGAEIAVLRDHTGKVYGVAYSPDGKRLASCGGDNCIRIWDTSTLEQVAQLRGHQDYVWSVAWSPDGQMLVSGSGDHTARIWETRPLAVRLRARHERREIVKTLEPRIKRLFASNTDPDQLVHIIRTDSSLSQREQQVATQMVLGRLTSDRQTTQSQHP